MERCKEIVDLFNRKKITVIRIGLQNTEEITGETNKGGEFEVAKKWKNGSTKEDVFADVKLTTKIGTIFPRGEADCLQIIDGKYLVCYNVYSGNNILNKKTGFVKYNGGL